MQTIYQEHGYKGRMHYLECLAEDEGVDLLVVKTLADFYGEQEDFDGLVTSIQDYADWN